MGGGGRHHVLEQLGILSRMFFFIFEIHNLNLNVKFKISSLRNALSPPLRAMGYLAFLDSGIILRQFQPCGRKSTHPGPFNTNVNSNDIQDAENNGFFIECSNIIV